jgi:hypothetical protein
LWSRTCSRGRSGRRSGACQPFSQPCGSPRGSSSRLAKTDERIAKGRGGSRRFGSVPARSLSCRRSWARIPSSALSLPWPAWTLRVRPRVARKSRVKVANCGGNDPDGPGDPRSNRTTLPGRGRWWHPQRRTPPPFARCRPRLLSSPSTWAATSPPGLSCSGPGGRPGGSSRLLVESLL